MWHLRAADMIAEAVVGMEFRQLKPKIFLEMSHASNFYRSILEKQP